MPINTANPVEVRPAVLAVQADEFLVTGFDVRERDIDTGEALSPGAIGVTVYWVKKLAGATVRAGGTFVPASDIAGATVDGNFDMRANIKALLYQALQTAGVFPEGEVT